LYLPLGVYEIAINDFEGNARPLAARDNPCLILIGRLRPGLTLPGADAQLVGVATSMEHAWPAENKNQTLIVRRLSRLGITTNPQSDSEVAMPFVLLVAMAAVVLLIAALNVANMMLARGMARRKEIAIRLALGGGRRSIVQQFLAEGLVLATLGGAAGLVLAYGATTLLVRSLGRLVPLDIVFHATPDARVLAATLAFCLGSTLLFALWPAWNLSRPNLVTDLKASGNEDPFRGKPNRLLSRRNLLVVAQVSLSLMLLTAAGLFLRQSTRAANVEPGFRLADGVVVELDASLAGYDELQGRRVYAAVLDRLRGIPGVQSVASAATVPFGMISLGRGIQSSAGSGAEIKSVASSFNIVSDTYFQTLGIPLLRGREFRAQDGVRGAPTVAILDKLAAKRLWPNEDALGKQIRLMPERDGGAVQEMEVVGIVGTVRERVIGTNEQSHIYIASGQQYQADTHIHLRLARLSPEDQQHILATIREEIRMVDSHLPVLAIKTLREHLENSADLWLVQTGARMFAISGFVALLLAVIGLYAVRAYSVARRTREIGIRMALGASSSETVRLMLKEGLALTAVGLGVGLALSLMVNRVLSGILYQVTAADPMVLGFSAAVLAAVSLLACYVPARKAAHVDPLVALRYE
jgi:putative ABC transport system permease protein